MALRDTIEAVQSGTNPEVARMESKPARTPFQERMLKAIKSVPERAVRKMAGIDKMDLPDDFNASGGLAKDVYKQLSDPVKAVWARGKEKSQMPMKEQAVAHVKDTGAILKEIAKAGGRLATSTVDATQMAARGKVDPIEWENVPILKNVPSYQRQTELKIQNGMSLTEALTQATRDITLDVLATYGTARGLQHIDKKIINSGSYKEVTRQVKSPTRGHGYDKFIKSGDMKATDVYVNKPKHILTPKAAKSIINDYAGQLDKYQKGLGSKLVKAVDPNKVKYIKGQAPQVVREANKLLRDTPAQNAAKATSVVKSNVDSDSVRMVGQRQPFKKPVVEDYRPRTDAQSLSASEDIVRRMREAYMEGNITKGELNKAIRENRDLIKLLNK